MDRAKRSAVAGLPDDILVEILSRVSVKDLYRSKCVSKAWCELVADPLHRKELPQTLHGFFYGGWGSGGDDAGHDGRDEEEEDESSDSDCGEEEDAGHDGSDEEEEDESSDSDGGEEDEDDEEEEEEGEEEDEDDHKKWISACLAPAPRYGHFINFLGRSAHLVDPSFPFLKILPGIDKHRLSLAGSCNGLLLFDHSSDSHETGFIVCNPATEQWAAVPCPCGQTEPPMDWHSGISCTYLIFDPAISSHFQLVMFGFRLQARRPTVHAYHSKTGAWRHSDTDWTEEERERLHRDLCYLPSSDAAVVNGYLYLVFEKKLIFQVDFEGKIRGIIPAPSSIVQQNPDYAAIFVGQAQGRLHCVNEEWGADDIPTELTGRVHIGDADEYTLLSIWVLDDNGSQHWVLKHSVSHFHLFGKLDISGAGYSVVAIHPDRNLVFIVQCWNSQLISYNMDSKEVRSLGTLEHGSRGATPFVPCFLDFSN